ncbi:hypothetical protein PV325_010401 [Microctonus aethiopoides]|nr:hypothetical protein PV325_010401 [Microctonus aethiopoides]
MAMAMTTPTTTTTPMLLKVGPCCCWPWNFVHNLSHYVYGKPDDLCKDSSIPTAIQYCERTFCIIWSQCCIYELQKCQSSEQFNAIAIVVADGEQKSLKSQECFYKCNNERARDIEKEEGS